MDDGPVNHALVHVCDGHLCVLLLLVQDVGRSAVRVNLLARLSEVDRVRVGSALLTIPVHWEVEIQNGAITTEYLAKMRFTDVLG